MLCKSMTMIKDPRYEHLSKFREFKDRQLLVPCRKCIPCKINKTSEWTMRLLMELQEWQEARFITLTYKPGTTPPNKTLVREDVSDFFKALRQNLGGRKIRYFACGEYGESDEDPDNWELGERPHYHAIVFGLTSSLEDRKACFDAWKRADEFQWFGKNWPKTCGTVTHDSCQYVSGYCQKKLFGELADEEYTKTGRIAPFQNQSNNLGEGYFLKHLEDYKRDGFIFFNGARHPIPETWKRKFEISLNVHKDEFYEKEKQEYLIKHPEVSDAEYEWYYSKMGVSLAQDSIENYEKHWNFGELIEARNNLRRHKKL